ncbi:MAG TPA: hypothetical protein DCW68_02575 [Rhodospirillaceae bacterium]|nr:MAG: hypothetical protein A2018_05550 [Alphaproteobacteria bacterium GWF2_58_20]HAU28979.1 hypothetical protein [Rhodospirillaceae bacterium]
MPKTLYFAWVEAGEVFAPTTHARQDEAVFDLSITEREGEFPAANVRIKAPLTGLLAAGRKRRAFISEDDGDGGAVLLFFGRLTGSPTAADGGMVEIELIAQPADWQDSLNALAASLRVAPFYDALFFDPAQDPKPEDSLAGRAAHYHWHRMTGALSLVSIFGDGPVIDLTGKHFWEDFSLSIGEPPLRSVAVRVEAQWTQQAGGTVDITDAVRAALGADPAYVSTLTGDDFLSRWPRQGQGIGTASGYVVADASLTEVLPGCPSGCTEWSAGAHYAVGDIVLVRQEMKTYPCLMAHMAGDFAADAASGYWDEGTAVDDSARPLRSVAATVSTAHFPSGIPADDMASEIRSLHLARRWFSPQLSLAWDYSQARVEGISATVAAGVQDIAFDQGGEDSLEFRLADVTLDTITPAWASGTAYLAGDYVKFGGGTFYALLDHTSGNNFWMDEFAGRWQRTSYDQSALGTVVRPSFFQTDRGRQAFEHALARAAAKVAASARCVEVGFRVPWEDGVGITTAHAVTISDPRLAGGQVVTGKVTEVVLARSSSAASVEVIMALAVGDGATPEAGEDEVAVPSMEGLVYAAYSAQNPLQPVLINNMNSSSYVVDDITISCDISEQNSSLSGAGDPAAVSPTAMTFRLRSIASADTLSYEIEVDMAAPFSPPKQIDLGA